MMVMPTTIRVVDSSAFGGALLTDAVIVSMTEIMAETSIAESTGAGTREMAAGVGMIVAPRRNCFWLRFDSRPATERRIVLVLDAPF
jgi:hypothetical protein